jgi:hypothetical protein
VLVDGDMYCWGNLIRYDPPAAGLLAKQSDGPSFHKILLPNKVNSIAVGLNHACALLVTGRIMCLGFSDDGQVDGFVHEFSEIPRPVSLDEAAVQVSAGQAHSCALLKNGKVYCWGSNKHGELGRGSIDGVPHTPGLARLSSVTHVNAGGTQTCAVSAKKAFCWGSKDENEPVLEPKEIWPGSEWSEVSASSHGVCGVLTTGSVCLVAKEEITGSRYLRLRVGDYKSSSFACGLQKDGVAECWGMHDLDWDHVKYPLPGVFADVLAGPSVYAITPDADVYYWELFSWQKGLPGEKWKVPWNSAAGR